jgi:tetratricopeptide (TPR) repeat protein
LEENRVKVPVVRLPRNWFQAGGGIISVEAPSGQERRDILRDLQLQAEQEGVRAWLLSCAFEDGGPWAGIQDLYRSLVEGVVGEQRHLLRQHDYELVHVLPELKRSLPVRNPCLTDIAGPDEKVRNYPADRAYRIVHGLIDLLAAVKGPTDSTTWVLLCDDFESIGHIGHRFFKELMRRRGESLRLTLVLATEPGRGEEAQRSLSPNSTADHVRVQASAYHPEPLTVEEWARRAADLEKKVRGDRIELQIRLAELIRLWTHARRPDRVFFWKCRGLDVYNTLGFYADALIYGQDLLREHRLYDPDNEQLRWAIFVKLFMSNVGLLKIEEAYRLVREEALENVSDPFQRAQLCYLVSMLHVRFLSERDLAKGEQYLEEGLAELQKASIDEEVYHFQAVFNRNGLALIRFFQGRHQEAIELCREGFRQLELYLSPEKHSLHRSVLLYNMAQVYSAMGDHEAAIAHYSAAMDMDPNYSEYYNDRGNAYFKMGRIEDALRDYLSAAELSAPYYEIYANLGQCWRAMARMPEAIEAYSRALDLQPGHALALLGRAQAREVSGDLDSALKDYNAALAVEPKQWEAYANRAVIHYELGRPHAAVADLSEAINLEPNEAALYQNRAIAFIALGKLSEAAADLASYLQLEPGADDSAAVREQLHEVNGKILHSVAQPA